MAGLSVDAVAAADLDPAAREAILTAIEDGRYETETVPAALARVVADHDYVREGAAFYELDDDGTTEVTVAVGIEPGDVLAATVEQQAERIDDLEAENAELRERLAAVENRIGMGDAAAPADD